MTRFFAFFFGYLAGDFLRSRQNSQETTKPPAPPVTEQDDKTNEPRTSVLRLGTLEKLATIAAGFATIVGIIIGVVTLKELSEQTKSQRSQTEQANRQNFLLAFEHMSSLREFLFQEPIDLQGERFTDYEDDPQRVARWPKPYLPTVSLVAEFARREPDIVIQALRPLLLDDASSVSSSTLLVLHALDSLEAHGAMLIKADLSGEDLSGVQLGNADLRRADLSGTTLSGAKLSEAELGEADLPPKN